MAQTNVYALPLFHEDKNEYLRVRRGIGLVAGGSTSVAYELPKNQLSERLVKEVLGRSGSDLEVEINKVLTAIQAPQPETALCDMIELDHAKLREQIRNVYPIDIDQSISALSSDNSAYLQYALKLSKKTESLVSAIADSYPFRSVLSRARDIVELNASGNELREVRMKENLEQIISSNNEEKLLLMSGALHVPNLELMLEHDGIRVVELESPERVSGIWWTAYKAILELKDAREQGTVSPYGPELMKYALLVSLSQIKVVSLNAFNKGGGAQISKEETAAISSITTFAEAEELYNRFQKHYRYGIADSIPLLGPKRD